jgi:hypothetical protein
MIGAFRCFEYAVVFLFVVSLAILLAQGLDGFVPRVYDYSAERELLEIIEEGCKTKQITAQQGGGILQIYRDDQPRFKLECWRVHLIYAVSICASAAVSVLLFKKYRSLRFRERLRDYFFPAKP